MLLQDYECVVEYYLWYLFIVQELVDRVGEGWVCWSLGNVYVFMGCLVQVLIFVKKYLQIFQEIGDCYGEFMVCMNVVQLQLVFGCLISLVVLEKFDLVGYEVQGVRFKRMQRLSVEIWDLLRFFLEWEQNGDSYYVGDWWGFSRDLFFIFVRSRKYQEGLDVERRFWEGSYFLLDSVDVWVYVLCMSILRVLFLDEECFFDLLIKFQSSCMDDQCCFLDDGQVGVVEVMVVFILEDRIVQFFMMVLFQIEEFFDFIVSFQSCWLDDQWVSVGSLLGFWIIYSNVGYF